MADYKNGIDISYCQTNVDWNKIKVDFAILRAGYGKYASQKDTMFEKHYAGAKSSGIPVGAYWYSYAMNEDDARREADACIDVLRGKQFEYPIYYDVEENKQFALGKAKVSAIIRAFLERVEAAGYWVGLYGSYSSLTAYTEQDIRDRYAIWLAHWGVTKSPYPGAYGIWQTGVGKIAGVAGDCDIDRGYVDYPTLIKERGLNGFAKQEETKPENKCPYPAPTKPVKENQIGDNVKWVQWHLARKGYLKESEIDGVFALRLFCIVCGFQKKNGLDVDGVVGAITRSALEK